MAITNIDIIKNANKIFGNYTPRRSKFHDFLTGLGLMPESGKDNFEYQNLLNWAEAKGYLEFDKQVINNQKATFIKFLKTEEN